MSRRWLAMVGAMAAALCAIGCAPTRQARSVQPSGFLGDAYPLLRDGGRGEAIKVYKKPGLNLAQYSRILIDPVKLEEAEDMSPGARENLQKLANNFYVYLNQQMKMEAQIVGAPGPNTLRLQAAIFDAGRRGPVRDLLSSVVPYGIAFSVAKDFVTGKPMGVGELSAEFKVTDAQTGELLAAAMDRRIGEKYSKITIDTWADADDAMAFWAHLIRYRYCQLHGGKDCVEPR